MNTTLSLKQKIELVEKLEKGRTVASVCEEYGVAKQTVSDIKKKEDSLRCIALKYSVTEASIPPSTIQDRKILRVAKDKKLEDSHSFFIQIPPYSQVK